MVHADTEHGPVEKSAIDGAMLEARGWVSFAMPASTASDLREQLLALASGLGTTAATRSERSVGVGPRWAHLSSTWARSRHPEPPPRKREPSPTTSAPSSRTRSPPSSPPRGRSRRGHGRNNR